MKKLFFASLLCIAFASCTKNMTEEETINPEGDNPTTEADPIEYSEDFAGSGRHLHRRGAWPPIICYKVH